MQVLLSLQVLAFAAALSGPAAAADWQFEREARRGADLRTAWVQNADGFRFSLIRKNDGRVTAVFELPEKTDALLGTAPPVFRVDQWPPMPVTAWGVFVDMGTRQVSWFIWDGTGDPCRPEPPAQDRKRALCDIMQGEQIVFAYDSVTGDSDEARFSLSGSRRAVERLLRE